MPPGLTEAQAREHVAAAGLDFATHPLIVLGIRPQLEQLNTYDAAIAVLTASDYAEFDGNTDPSDEQPNRATLKPGVWTFKPGIHHPGQPTERPAFVQAEPVVVHRWGTDDVAIGVEDDRGRCLGNGFWIGWFAIHIHDGGENTTGSEGCQTIIKHEWVTFRDLVNGKLKELGLAAFPYLLVQATAGWA